MNRNEEYRLLLEQLENPPAALEDCVERARRKAHRRSGWRTSLASLGGAAAAFVLAVNLSLPFAMACSRIPGLRELTAAVAFSSSLKAAVQNEHVQLIAQSQTENGITLNMDYLIFDSAQLHFFYSVTGGDYDTYHVQPKILGLDGEKLHGYGLTSAPSEPGELADFSVIFESGVQAPEGITLTCDIFGYRNETSYQEAPVHSGQTEEGSAPVATVTFTIVFDPKFTAPGETLAIDRWVTIDGQRLDFRTLEINPTHAKLTVEFDENNTAWCRGLEFSLIDSSGEVYEAGSRASSGSDLLSSGSGEDGKVVYYLESPHFTGKAPYTIRLTKVTWLDKEDAWVAVDLQRGVAQGLPAGCELLEVCREKDGVRLAFSYTEGNGIFSWDYRDPEGEEYRLDSAAFYTRTDENGLEYKVTELFLTEYPYDSVEMKLSYNRNTELTTPIDVTIP